MNKIADIWNRVNRTLFPHLKECLPQVTETQLRLAAVLEPIRIEDHIRPVSMQWYERKMKDRKAIARAFVAKVMHKMPTTRVSSRALLP